MHLSKYTDYSFRVLMYLASHSSRLVTIQEIANAYAISKNHLVKIVHRLSVAGMIESIPGKKGGIRLGRDSKAINLLEVIEITETDFDLAECFTKDGYCPIQGNCKLTKILTEALFSFFKVLGRYTIYDLVRNEALRTQLQSMRVGRFSTRSSGA